ncbi:hypothetical protein [Parasphingorhabdus sp.]|uniref:hypothetical protein n=1 Tax=Parasphingorhabdus sp. TaxID=2709688 RepID=UPI003264E7D1
MKKRLLQITAGAILLATAAPAFALQCLGTLTNVYLNDAGAVIILPSYAPSYTQICNIKTDWKGISKDICWGWFSQANNAVVESRQFRVSYQDTSATCGTLPAYSNAPAPYYIMLY